MIVEEVVGTNDIKLNINKSVIKCYKVNILVINGFSTVAYFSKIFKVNIVIRN